MRIKEILETGSVFDIDASQNPYDLLPPWWFGMSVDQNKTAVDVVVASRVFTGDCLIELQEQLFIPMSDMQQFRACCECAIEDSTHLDTEPTDVGAEEERAANQQAAEILWKCRLLMNRTPTPTSSGSLQGTMFTLYRD